jgi:hypothetical protein
MAWAVDDPPDGRHAFPADAMDAGGEKFVGPIEGQGFDAAHIEGDRIFPKAGVRVGLDPFGEDVPMEVEAGVVGADEVQGMVGGEPVPVEAGPDERGLPALGQEKLNGVPGVLCGDQHIEVLHRPQAEVVMAAQQEGGALERDAGASMGGQCVEYLRRPVQVDLVSEPDVAMDRLDVGEDGVVDAQTPEVVGQWGEQPPGGRVEWPPVHLPQPFIQRGFRVVGVGQEAGAEQGFLRGRGEPPADCVVRRIERDGGGCGHVGRSGGGAGNAASVIQWQTGGLDSTFAVEKLHNGLRAGTDLQFLINVAEVAADGVEADAEVVGDLLVAMALGQQFQNLEFALGEVVLIRAGRGLALEVLHDDAGDAR